MQFYFEGPLIFDRKAHFFEGMDLHPQPPQRNSQVRDSNPCLIETNKYQAWGSNPRPHRSTTLGIPTTLGDQPSTSEQTKIIR